MGSTYKEMTPATVEEMIKHYGPGVVAWSPETDEEYSANPRDYWADDPLLPLVDSKGNEMFLVRRITTIEPI